MSPGPVWPPPQVEVRGSFAAMDPDLDLLAAWRGGDKAAASTILKKYYFVVRQAVLTKVPEAAIDDIVQDVFEALVEGRDTFRADASLKTFVLKITRNTIADFFRERERKPVDHVGVLQSSVRDLCAGPSSLLLKHEKDRILLEALRSIALDDQFILELYYWDDMSGPDLAQVFECPEPAIRSRLRRAKERLTEAVHELTRDRREFADTVTNLDSWAKQLRDELKPYLQQFKQDKARKK